MREREIRSGLVINRGALAMPTVVVPAAFVCEVRSPVKLPWAVSTTHINVYVLVHAHAQKVCCKEAQQDGRTRGEHRRGHKRTCKGARVPSSGCPPEAFWLWLLFGPDE